MDEQNYLDPDFDPFTLRVADLRKILLLHNVPFSSTSKKQDLVDLFKKNIAANAAAILASQKKVKPSSRGILMVGDRKTSDMYNDSDDEQNSPVEAKKEKGRGKKPVKREESSTLDDTRATFEDEEVFAVPAPKPKGRLSKKDTVKSEPDVVTSSEFDNPAVTTPQTPVTRRGRKKRTEVETPGLTDTDADDYSKTPRDKSPFSDHNPFQSGGEGTPEKSSRRKSGVSRRGRSTSRSRRSLMHVDSPSDFNTPITKSGYYSPGQPTPPKFGDTVEHPSAFPVTSPAALTTPTPILLHKFMSPPSVGTPDTDDLLEEKSPINPFVNAPVAEAEASTVSASSPGAKVRAGFKKKANRRTDGELVIEEYNWASVWVIVLLMLLANGVWWRHEKVKIGYCEMTNQESNNEVSHPLAFLYPKCIPCPAYAKCVGGQLVSCDDNFVRTRNPLSLGGLIPLSDWCEPDAEKQQRAVEVANELRRQLNIRAGEVECGHIKVNRSLSKAEAAGMKVDDAYKQLIALKDVSRLGARTDVWELELYQH
ncbi:Man1-Src1p-C-terminal domain-containing protein [Endogone sp. FLAS-F59071]|nr:Man1-Src1p-C-terminal domain-containing protein [Endogone sp. FLAS-F59071]|eukprot:RUS16530.1 Man1-Src1p-C-terminal domain-containing protein [Endogone sp. FLAS-F59071]